MPAEHKLWLSMVLPCEREKVFGFFAEAGNLERITPPELHFHIVSPKPIVLGAGVQIEYRLRLHGWAFNWLTQITRWEPPCMFVDEQIAGPYGSWVHTHRFHEQKSGTVIEDDVRYRLPLYPLGEVALPLVRWQLRRIFAFRQQTIREVFNTPGS